jgi:hypothetical protein
MFKNFKIKSYLPFKEVDEFSYPSCFSKQASLHSNWYFQLAGSGFYNQVGGLASAGAIVLAFFVFIFIFIFIF